MRSRAHFKTHPVHPMLVGFPIAFFIATLVFDFLGILYENPGFWEIAYYLEIAGIATALLAAIPGLIDFLFTVPPKSSGKKRAAIHGLLNVTHVAIFFMALMIRRGEDANMNVVIGLEAAGVILLSVAGWMGGTLVYRNQIGVDHRYADAGKWNEEYKEASNGEIEVATIDELQINQMKLLHINNERIIIGRTENGYRAFNDHCTHKGGSLAGGAMICGTVQCPWHGSQFDVQTGEVKAGPAKEKIVTYRVSERHGKVYLQSREV